MQTHIKRAARDRDQTGRNIACSVLFASERHSHRPRPSERDAVVAARHSYVAVAGRITRVVPHWCARRVAARATTILFHCQ